MTRRIADLRGADPYALLGVSVAASAEDIQRAYRKVMREAHPDMVTGDEDRTKLINIARDVLLDPDLRAEWDRRAMGVQPPAPPPSASAWDAEDIVVDGQPPPADPRPAYRPPGYSPPPPAYDPFSPPYPARPVPSGGIGLGVWALIAAFLCGGLPGAILGAIALMQHPKPEGANKVCAVIAVCLGAAYLLCCLGYLAVLGTGLTASPGA